MSQDNAFSKLTSLIASQFSLDVHSPHGPSHWMRVKINGLNLAIHTGANKNVVGLFSIFHDSRRENDQTDHGHGVRGADLAYSYFKKGLVPCTEHEMDTLMIACQGHTDGSDPDNITIATCWDADRLDLPRVGIEVNPKYLCTDYAKQSHVISGATERALLWVRKMKNLEVNGTLVR